MPILDEYVQGICLYMNERESIRKAKEADRPKPWTSDPILQRNRFTNVLRADDRTTRWAIHNWYIPLGNYPKKMILINCALFRLFGLIETAEEIGYLTDLSPESLEAKRLQVWNRYSKGKKTFTSAYIITNGGAQMPKINYVFNVALAAFIRKAQAMADVAEKTHSWKDVVDIVRTCAGLGGSGFVAKEIIQDAILAGVFGGPPIDAMTWSPIGPGARRGLNRVCGRPADFKQKEALYLEEMKEMFTKVAESGLLADHTSKPFDRLDLHGMQFNLCEYDKYLRVKTGEGRMKSTYPGV